MRPSNPLSDLKTDWEILNSLDGEDFKNYIKDKYKFYWFKFKALLRMSIIIIVIISAIGFLAVALEHFF